MATSGEQKPIRTNYEIFILTLSLLSIVNLLIALLPIDQDVKNLVYIIDVAITPIFLFDFFRRLISAPSKGGYLIEGGGWLDFIGSLPFPSCGSRDCIVCGTCIGSCVDLGCGTSGLPLSGVVPRAR